MNKNGKAPTLDQVHDARNGLVRKYGTKIIPGIGKELTKEEYLAQGEYKNLTEQLYKISPVAKEGDRLEVNILKDQMFWQKLGAGNMAGFVKKVYKFAVKVFWVIFAFVALVILYVMMSRV